MRLGGGERVWYVPFDSLLSKLLHLGSFFPSPDILWGLALHCFNLFLCLRCFCSMTFSCPTLPFTPLPCGLCSRPFLYFLMIFFFCCWSQLDFPPLLSPHITSRAVSCCTASAVTQGLQWGAWEQGHPGIFVFTFPLVFCGLKSLPLQSWGNGVCAVERVRFTYPPLEELSFHFLK